MKVDINKLKENTDNPRRIDYFKLEQLKSSIKEFPEMLELRPIIVNEDFIIIGGNMRWKAAKELGFTEIPVKIMTNKDKEYEFLVKDNLSYGDWNWNSLTEDYKSNDLMDWGLDVPLYFREEELNLDDLEVDNNTSKGNTKEDKKDVVKSSKKALYLFYSIEDKNTFSDLLKEKRGEQTNEAFIMELIKKTLENESIEG